MTRRSLLPGLGLALTMASLVPLSQAETIRWNGNANNDNWSSGGNWIGGSPPTAADNAGFDPTSRLTVNVNGDYSIQQLRFTRFDTTLDGSTRTLSLTGISVPINWDSSHNIKCKVHLLGDAEFNTKDSLNIQSTISGETGAGIIKLGPDPLVLSKANTFTGATMIRESVVEVKHRLALQNSTVFIESDSGDNEELRINATGTVVLGGLVGPGDLAIPTGVTLRVGGNGETTSHHGTLSGNNVGLEKAGTGTLSLATSNTFVGPITLTDGSLVVNADSRLGSAGNELVFKGGELRVEGSFTTNRTLSFSGSTSSGAIRVPNASRTLTHSGSLSGGTGNFLEKTGNGTLQLDGSASFAGLLGIPGGKVITKGGLLASAVILLGGGTELDVTSDGVATSVGALSGSGMVALGSQGLTVGGSNSNNTYSGILSGSGKITKTGTGVQTISGANTWSGLLDINNGQIRLGSSTALQHATVQNLVSDGIDLNGFHATFGGLAGGSLLNLGNRHITIGGNNSDRSYWGVISGTGSITKVGSGYWHLSGNNAYTGTTSINAGTLKGAGSVAGPLVVSSNGEVHPGAPAGSFTAHHNATIAGTYVCEVGGGLNDKLEVGGTLNLTGSTIDFDVLAGGTTEPVYVIATYGSLTGIFGTLIDLPAGYGIDYAYHDGVSSNQIALVTTAPPNAISIAPTGGSLGRVEVAFDKPVVNFDAFADLVVSTSTGTAMATGATITGGGSGWTVQLTGLSGDGSLTLAVNTGSNVQDSFGGALVSSVTSQAISFDLVPPTATITALTASPTNAATVSFAVAFSESIANFEASDLTVSFSGNHDPPVLNGTASPYTVTVSNVSGDGDLVLGFAAGNDITDAVGNPLGASPGSDTITIDNTAPVVIRFTTAESSPTKVDSIRYNLIFSERVHGLVDGSDILLTQQSAATTDLDQAVIYVNRGLYSVTLHDIAGDGLLQFRPKYAQVTDDAGNSMSEDPANYSPAVTIDNTAPVITITGDPAITQIEGGSWVDPGSEATDNIDASVTVNLGGDTVLPNIPGSYTINYDATDTAGNRAMQKSRTVTIVSYYDAWSSDRGLEKDVNDAPGDDPDGDQRPNLAEFALDGDPLSGTNDGKFVSAAATIGDNDYLTLTFPVRVGASFSGDPSPTTTIDGVSYTVQASAFLAEWNQQIIEVDPALSSGLPALSTGWQYHTFRYPQSIAAEDRVFMRVGISETP